MVTEPPQSVTVLLGGFNPKTIGSWRRSDRWWVWRTKPTRTEGFRGAKKKMVAPILIFFFMNGTKIFQTSIGASISVVFYFFMGKTKKKKGEFCFLGLVFCQPKGVFIMGNTVRCNSVSINLVYVTTLVRFKSWS